MWHRVGLQRLLHYNCLIRNTQALVDKRCSRYLVLILFPLVLIISSSPMVMMMGGLLSYASPLPPLTSPSFSFTNSNSFSNLASSPAQISILVSKPSNTSNDEEVEDNNGGAGIGMAEVTDCPELKIIQPNSLSANNDNENGNNTSSSSTGAKGDAQTLSQLLQRNITIDTDNECGYTLDAGKLSAPAFGANILEDRRH